jgi:hypothetical protein
MMRMALSIPLNLMNISRQTDITPHIPIDRLAYLDRQEALFDAVKPHLLTTYPGEFIAFENSLVLDHHTSKQALAQRVFAQRPNQDLRFRLKCCRQNFDIILIAEFALRQFPLTSRSLARHHTNPRVSSGACPTEAKTSGSVTPFPVQVTILARHTFRSSPAAPTANPVQAIRPKAILTTKH